MRRGQTLGRTCTIPCCDRPHLAKGLCALHYKRAWRGVELEPREPEVGSPSGHGQYGILDDDGDTVLCHECGERKRALGYHVRTAHGMTAAEYRSAHGLPRRLALVTTSVRERLSEQARARVGSDGWRRLEDARDPEAAAAARDRESFRRVGAHREKVAEVARINGATTARALGECVVCGTEFQQYPTRPSVVTCSDDCWRALQSLNQRRSDTLVRHRAIRILLDTGRTTAEVAELMGCTPQTVRVVRRGEGRA